MKSIYVEFTINFGIIIEMFYVTDGEYLSPR